MEMDFIIISAAFVLVIVLVSASLVAADTTVYADTSEEKFNKMFPHAKPGVNAK